MSIHAPLAPSSAHRWAGQCAASVQMEATATAYQDAAVDRAAEEGDAAHWVAVQALHGAAPIEADTAAPNGVIVDEEMLEAVGEYVADIIKTGLPVRIEETIQSPRIHPSCWGTPDAWTLFKQGTAATVFLWDFKYGHRFVDAWENWQLLCYAAGLLDHELVTLAGYKPAALTFHFRIVQPRNYHRDGPVRTWNVSGDKLLEYIGRIKLMAQAAMGSMALAKLGEECTDCKARHTCTLLQTASYDAMEYATSTAALTLSPSALGVELHYLHRAHDLLTARLKGLEQQALAHIKAGQSVSGFMVEKTSGREVWTVPPADVFTLGDAMGVDLRKPSQAITPNQARKAGMNADIVGAYANRPGGAIKLVPADNTKARKIFGHG